MSEAQDIREWARGRGIDLGDRGRIPGPIREQYEQRDDEPVAVPWDDGDEPVVEVGFPPDSPPEPPAAVDAPVVDAVPERRPVPPPRKRRGMFQRKPPTTKRPAPRRVSVENIVGSGWMLAGMALMRSPRSIPVARVLQMQAPVAGVIGDELLRGTLIDKILQPLARAGEKGEKAMALVGPPLLVGAITSKPEMYPVLRPVLKMTLMSWMQVAGPAMKKAERRAAEFAESFGDIDIDGMIDALWADLPVPVVESEQEEENIRRARGDG